jgi:hypothetical protein
MIVINYHCDSNGIYSTDMVTAPADGHSGPPFAVFAALATYKHILAAFTIP